jgi:NAD(P)-dependent dehydrogenase (short-subunit alcohol dehydrogenase family)
VARFEGKVVVISGAGRGIGRAEALLFARHGAKVVVNDLGGGCTGGGSDPSAAEAVVNEIRSLGGEAIVETSSIDSMSAGKALIDTALKAYGRIDVLSNNAGIFRPGPLVELDEDDFDRVIAVNLKGYFATIHAAAPYFIAQRSGVIICKGSPSGFGHYGLSTYSAAKEGVAGLTRTVARELGRFGVRANLIRPMSYITNMITPELVKMADEVHQRGEPVLWNRGPTTPKEPTPAPEHVAALTAWLASDATAQVNGREFFIAGPEVGILPEAELQRALFEPKGWTLEAFDCPETHAYLIGEAHNRFGPK